MSNAVIFNDSDSIKKGNRNKKLIIAVIVLILILGSSLAWAITHKKPKKKQSSNSANSGVVVVAKPTPEQIKLAKENIGTSGKIVTINTSTKTITLKKTDNTQADYIYNDKSTVHKGVSNLDASFSDLKEGLDVSLSYEETDSGKIVKDVWYLK